MCRAKMMIGGRRGVIAETSPPPRAGWGMHVLAELGLAIKSGQKTGQLSAENWPVHWSLLSSALGVQWHGCR